MADRLFSLAEAQALLDGTVRALAERLVENRARARPLAVRWQQVVMAVGSNGGALPAREVAQMRSELEALTGEARAIIDEITALGVQVKDPEQGLLDFPSVVEGRDALLCWRVGEDAITSWHPPDEGFAGRRPL